MNKIKTIQTLSDNDSWCNFLHSIFELENVSKCENSTQESRICILLA